jgi:hypothetical protein
LRPTFTTQVEALKRYRTGGQQKVIVEHVTVNEGGQAPAVGGWTVCRFHGAGGGGPKGKRNGMYRHGLYTKEAVERRRHVGALLRQAGELLSAVDDITSRKI